MSGPSTQAAVTAERPAAKTPHDLPPRWDGRAVIWSPWVLADDGSLAFHSALADLACQQCGSLARQHWRSVGLVSHLATTTHEQLHVAVATSTAGRCGERRLSVRRCLDCGHDQVLDLTSDELWDLDATDYGPDGSAFDRAAHQAALVQAARAAIRPTRPSGPAQPPGQEALW